MYQHKKKPYNVEPLRTALQNADIGDAIYKLFFFIK